MRDKYIQTAESVTEGHPDKLCDTIAGAVSQDNMGPQPKPSEAGSAGRGGARERTQFSPSGGNGVERTLRRPGAGDQGIMYGYACSETPQLLPLPVALAHRLTLLLTNARKVGIIHGLGPDGKAQVSVEYENGKPKRIAAVVVSCQHDAGKDLDELRREITRHVIVPALRDLYPDPKTEILINPSGRFVPGGFEADTGLTGRKLMADTCGGLAPHGGGALSGKDGTKVDRSGGLYGPVHRREHRGGGTGGEMHRQPRLRHRQGYSADERGPALFGKAVDICPRLWYGVPLEGSPVNKSQAPK